MPIAFLFPEYFIWHYTTALRLCLNIVTNFLWFTYHFFSIPVLLKTLFSPWHKIQERYRGGFHLGDFAETVVINTLMRLVGFVIRTVVIVFGCGFYTMTAIVGMALFLIWLVLPFVVVGLIILGLRFLFV